MNKQQKQVIQQQYGSEKAVLKELERQYQEALDEINQKIQMYQSMPETQSRIYRRQYQENLKKQVEAALEKLHSGQYETIDQYLQDTYKDGFVGTMYDMHGQSVPVIVPIDQNAAIKAVLTDTKLKHNLYDELGIDIKAMKKTISSELSRGIASGMAYDDIARNIKAKTKAPLKRAKTIVRTEGHRIQQASAEDARQAAKAKGADVVKQWDATLDGDTRPTHRRLDGQIRETDEPFEMDGKKAMYPGDFGDPAEDCNCRCVALTRARAALDEDELETLKKRAEFFELDKKDSYKEFKKKYLKAAETVEKQGKSGIINTKKTVRKIKDGTTVVNPMDASKYAKLKSNLQKKGVTVLQATGDDLAYMQAFGAEATYGGGYIMHIGEIPSASALYEEIIHWTQAVKYGELVSTDPVELCAREVAANRKLLRNGYAYGFDDVDFEDIERNLATWESKFEELVGVTYDESDYRRDV